ncbi:TonB-dependent receptor [Aequorivita echinoideorum]|uniref:TonB-dependent receptor n=1 Tax=Aequorivita echinoideorum TaxID=1549647 RepID=UPI00293D3575|nr:TonB-dependent receptor [Aequorivita echinoideorum]
MKIMVWSCLTMTSLLSAQNTYNIKGVVMDNDTKLPIEGASISLNQKTYVSSEEGNFLFQDVPSGTFVISVSHLGYSKKTFEIFVPTKTDLILALTQEKTNLETVQLHGKTNDRSSRENPQSTVLVSREFMELNRNNSLMQTLENIPGVSTINIGSGQSKPVIRGLGFNRVSVVQNGIKHEAQQWGNDHGLEIDQYGIDNIQIIKGPASVMYGSDAIAGVVDILPPKIPIANSFGGEVNFLAESNNDLLGISMGLEARKQKWFYRGRFTYRNYADYRVPTDQIRYESYIFELDNRRLRNTAGREANAALSVGFLGDNFKTETFFSNVNAKNGFFANAHGLEVRTSTIDYDSRNRDIDLPFHRVNHFKIVNNSTFYTENQKILVEVGFQNNHREEHSEPVPHGYMPTPPDSRERIFRKNTLTINAKDLFDPINGHHLAFGFNMEYQNNSIGGWGFLIPEYNRWVAGIFAFDRIEFSDQWNFQGGCVTITDTFTRSLILIGFHHNLRMEMVPHPLFFYNAQ